MTAPKISRGVIVNSVFGRSRSARAERDTVLTIGQNVQQTQIKSHLSSNNHRWQMMKITAIIINYSSMLGMARLCSGLPW